jgi:hypothetical protein
MKRNRHRYTSHRIQFSVKTRTRNIFYIILAVAYFNAAFATIEREIPKWKDVSDKHGVLSSKKTDDFSGCDMRRRHARMIRSYSSGPVLFCLGVLPAHNSIEIPQHPSEYIQPLISDEWIHTALGDVSPPISS